MFGNVFYFLLATYLFAMFVQELPVSRNVSAMCIKDMNLNKIFIYLTIGRSRKNQQVIAHLVHHNIDYITIDRPTFTALNKF